MNFNEINNFLNKFDANRNNDVECILEFLNNSQFGEVPIILYNRTFWLNSVIVPKKYLESNYIDNLMNWSFYPSSYSYSISSEGDINLTNPCESYIPKEILENATPVFLERSTFNHTSSTIEINQKISHRLDICEDDKNHFYKLNEYGDKKEVASIMIKKGLKVTFLNREELNKYLYISDSVLIRFFNITLLKGMPITCSEEITKLKDKNIYFKNCFQYDENGNLVFKELRGFQIISNNQEFINNKINYQEFKVVDFESGNLITHSCDPNKLGNFFVDSDYINELSLVFFRTDVFNNYNDADKYVIENRHILCKGVWSLRYFLSDDKKQVIVYIKDLAKLPENEQILWSAFNEEPKSGIPNHIIRTDFLGEWDNVIDPLVSLKECLFNFPSCYIDGDEMRIWVEKNKGNIRSLDNLQYIKHPTKEKWDFEVMKLYQIVVEGFETKKIKKIAKKLNCPVKNLKSLKLLNCCIKKLYGENMADLIMGPLFELYSDRVKLSHSKDGEIYPKNLIEDYNNKIKGCFVSMEWLSNEIKKGKFNFN